MLESNKIGAAKLFEWKTNNGRYISSSRINNSVVEEVRHAGMPRSKANATGRTWLVQTYKEYFKEITLGKS